MSDGRRQYDLDRMEAQRAQETEDWLARMRAERRAEEACCPSFARFGYHGFGCVAPRDYCCNGSAQGIGHDGTCSERFSRSAGS